MGNISTERFTVKLYVLNCRIRSVQRGLNCFGMRRDCEDSSSRRDDFIVGSGRSSVEDDDVCKGYMS